MDKLINEFMAILKDGGCTDLEIYDVLIHEFQLAINHFKQKRNEKTRQIYNNLNQITFEDYKDE